MNLESQVTSIELSKRLRYLGVPQESIFYHLIYNSSETHIIRMQGQFETMDGYFEDEIYSAFTASELLELLPIFISGYNILTIQKDYPIGFETFYSCSRTELGFDSKDENICNSLAKMLIYLIENNLLDIK